MTGLPQTALPADVERTRQAELRERGDRLDAYIDSTGGCRATIRSCTMTVCWLEQRPEREAWNDVLMKLDSLGIESIQVPAQPRAGLDGWTIVVELRAGTNYRAYSFWHPDSAATDSGERAAANVAAVLRDAFRRRVAK